MKVVLLKYTRFLFIEFFFYLIFFGSSVSAQTPVKQFKIGEYPHDFYSIYRNNKKIPIEIEAQVLIALSFYPELENEHITFRFRKRKTPLSSRPRLFSLFKKKENRKYVITISTKTTSSLTPILFKNLPYNAQIGVLGHEIAHIVEYNQKKNLQIIGLAFKMLNSNYVNGFEFNTDRIAIKNGLGYQLYDWSSYVRKVLNIKEWKGSSNISSTNQRYMNPETIEKEIKMYSIYKHN